MRIIRNILVLVSFFTCHLSPFTLDAQSLLRFDVPTSICTGSSQTITFGYESSHNIVVGEEGSTLGHSERIFLPDGVPCGTMGCSYRSPVTFTAFESGATITSAEDIKYLRLNIEHSWIGDIYVGITCPSGQKASLINYSGEGSSSCTSTIPSNHRGWSTGDNVAVGTFLGSVRDEESTYSQCDSTASGNEPGRGWNYCWSSNTTSGYTYAHASENDDGIIYRSGHAHANSNASTIIDSSNVAAKTNFYHPNQNFESLIGCPLNGNWYIEVLDGWSGDNGYIFEWELSLDADLIPPDTCVVDSFLVTGYGVTKENDSTFTINAPSHMAHDTTLYYNFHVFSSCGNDIDSTVAVTFYTLHSHIDTTICDNHPFHIGTESLNETGEYSVVLSTAAHCDSVISISLTALPHHDIHIYDSTCKYEGLSFNDSIYYQAGTYSFSYTNSFGCDSIRTLHLVNLGENLKAEIKAIPLLVTPMEPDIRLYNYSLNSSSGLWIIDGHEYSDRYLTYTFPDEADSLPVMLLAYSDDGCIDTAITVIHIDRSTMFTPNVFTPNQSTNNIWQPGMMDILSLELWIYSREGLLVYHSEGAEVHWDGTRDGEPCPQGAYVFTLLYRTVAKPEIQQKTTGTILLLR
jgi:gliding motility-associated-like protein